MWTQSLFIVVVCSLAFAAAYLVYGKFLSRAIFSLSADSDTPAVSREDGIDFVPTRKLVLFGHHFASIAGLGPILGPAVAVMWGWAPALLWVVLGGIFIGAVHDLGTMVASVRHGGRSIGDVCRDLIGPRARVLFLVVCFFAVALAMGVFALVVAKLFVHVNPKSIIPVVSLIAIAVVVGLATYRWKVGLTPATLVGLALMFLAMWAGIRYPVKTYRWFLSAETRGAIAAEMSQADGALANDELGADVAKHFEGLEASLSAAGDAGAAAEARARAAEIVRATSRAMHAWIWALLVYAFAASVLPVWLLLQPRDYLNSYQLYIGLALIVVLLAVAHPQIQAPAVTAGPSDPSAPPLVPFLFIIIACGAVSGFHSLVSSGTTARQLRREPDARVIGYGGMIVESLMAVLVILACTSGGAAVAAKWQPGGLYATTYRGIQDKALGTFAEGVGSLSASIHPSLPPIVATVILVVVVGFAITTLDTGTRLLRFNVEELSRIVRLRPLGNRYVASLAAAFGVGYFALFTIEGKPAGMTLWVLFGATNQLLAALGLLAVSVYLFLSRRPVWFTLAPMALMLVLTLWAMAAQMGQFWADYQKAAAAKQSVLGPVSLLVIGGAIIVIAVWLFVEGVIVFMRKRGDEAAEKVPAG